MKRKLDDMSIYEAVARTADVLVANVGDGSTNWKDVVFDEVAMMYIQAGDDNTHIEEWERHKLAMRIVKAMIDQELEEYPVE